MRRKPFHVMAVLPPWKDKAILPGVGAVTCCSQAEWLCGLNTRQGRAWPPGVVDGEVRPGRGFLCPPLSRLTRSGVLGF